MNIFFKSGKKFIGVFLHESGAKLKFQKLLNPAGSNVYRKINNKLQYEPGQGRTATTRILAINIRCRWHQKTYG